MLPRFILTIHVLNEPSVISRPDGFFRLSLADTARDADRTDENTAGVRSVKSSRGGRGGRGTRGFFSPGTISYFKHDDGQASTSRVPDRLSGHLTRGVSTFTCFLFERNGEHTRASLVARVPAVSSRSIHVNGFMFFSGKSMTRKKSRYENVKIYLYRVDNVSYYLATIVTAGFQYSFIPLRYVLSVHFITTT